MNRVLVTGGNGFMGRALCKHWVAQGIPVRALVYPGTPTDVFDGAAVECVPGDITQAETLKAPLRDVDCVVHLAAKVGDWGPSKPFHRSIVDGTRQVLQGALEAGVRRVVHMSSLAVHAYSGHPESDESSPLDGRLNAYARAKVEAERVLASFSNQLETVVIRPGLFPYGPGDRLSFGAMAQALRGRKLALVDGGRHRVGLSYLENLVEGIALCASHPKAAGEVFVLADDDVLTWKQLLSDLADAVGAPRPVRSVPHWAAHVAGAACEGLGWLSRGRFEPPLTRYRAAVVSSDLVFRNDKAKRILGFVPKVGWLEGLRRSAAWFLASSLSGS